MYFLEYQIDGLLCRSGKCREIQVCRMQMGKRTLFGSKFKQCDFLHLTLSHALVANMVFKDCVFRDTVLEDVEFENVKFKNCQFSRLPEELKGCKFIRCSEL